ncbi:unnamed protein product, partial [Tetraodon nigroviridis]
QPSTLPQGTVNMNLCTDVVDAEPITGQKNSLCIITPEQEYFIRGENKEIINGWSEQLMVYPRTNKQNQKKKRKVEPATSQEPGPAKVAVTGFGIPEAESVPDSSSIIWQEELSQREADAAAAWPKADLPSGSPLSPAGDRASAAQGSDGSSVNGDEVDRGSLVLHASAPQPSSDLLSPTGSCSSLGGVPRCLSPAPSDPFPSGSSLLSNGSHISGSVSSLDSDASGGTVTSTDSHPTNQRSSHSYSHHDTPRSRRLEAEARKAEKRSRFASTLPPLRRAKSLDRRTTESVMTPDLLNFKKGWMVKLDEQGQWKKFWFVLTDHSLRYYKDSIAEEASDLDGEIDLSTCSNVTEYQAQRNYGFQIHVGDTLEGVHTLSAMTAGIRRNWMQAIMKNVRPSTAPDVARPDVTQDSPSSETSSVERESVPGVIKSRARERRREGRSKTFDWAEFRPIAQALAQQRAQEAESLHAELGEPERNRRREREERRRRYETVAGSSAENTAAKVGAKTDYEPDVGFRQTHTCSPTNSERQQRVEEVIEQYWQQVEKTPIREERRVPLPPCGAIQRIFRAGAVAGTLQAGEDLKAQLENCHQQLLDSNKHKQELELQLRTALEREQDTRAGYISPLEHALGLEADVMPQMKRPELVSSQAQSLTKKYQETKELLKLQELKKRNMQAQLGLSLSHMKETCFSDPQTSSILECPPHELVQKTVSFLLQDSTEAIQELEDSVTEKPVTLVELTDLLRSHSCTKETEKHHIQKLFANWKNQQELENETLKKSLARAGESIREYESRLLTMEDMVEKVQKQNFESLKSPYGPLSEIEKHSEATELSVGILSQRVELLTGENEALKQRCQEIVNQLTEADREIDRLKAELTGQQGGRKHHQDAEELKRLKEELAENKATAIDREYYERELNEKSLRLHEALVTLEELGSTLKDTEKKLQLKEATLKGLGFRADYEEEELHSEEERLKELLEASQVKLSEMEAQLQHAQQQCYELESRNGEMVRQSRESEREYGEKLREAENEIRTLQEKLETKTFSKCVEAGGERVHDKGLSMQVVDKIAIKRQAISQVLEMLARVDADAVNMLTGFKHSLFGSSDVELVFLSPNDRSLLIEGEFWSQLLGINKTTPEEDGHGFERHVAEQMMAQKRLTLLMRSLCPQAESEAGMRFSLSTMYEWLDNEAYALIRKELADTLKAKSDVLRQIASNVGLVKDENLLASLVASFDFALEQKPPSEYLSDALMEACVAYGITRMKVEYEKQIKQVREEVQSGKLDCPNCVKLRDAIGCLESKLADVQNRLSEVLKSSTGAQTLTQTEVADIMAKHLQELQDVKVGYEQEAQNLRQEVMKANEELRVSTEEKGKEIHSLTMSIEKLEKKHELERANLIDRFDREMEELRDMVSPTEAEQKRTEEHRPPHRPTAPTSTLKERIQELVNQVSVMTQEMRRREEQGDITTVRQKYERDLENLKATCERRFAAMEESHQKVIDELQRKHQRELENLQEEKERLLAEETAATIAAIEAMKNAHRTEMEKELEKARKANSNSGNADMEEIRKQHEEELCSFQREIEVLSEQYSQKCLENAHLAQALEAERQALRQCQRENQELNAHNQELNNRLAAEITKMRSMAAEDGLGDANTTIQGKELYELEVMLRVKESEVQYLKQEINSLKDELHAAQRDKKYATDKYKDIYTELSIVKAKAERDQGRLRDQLQLAHEALGEPTLEEVERGGYDIMKSKSNPDILKMAAAAAKRSERTMRSK